MYSVAKRRGGRSGELAPARGVGVGERDEAKLRRRVEDQVLGEAAHVQHDHARREEKLDDEVPVAHLRRTPAGARVAVGRGGRRGGRPRFQGAATAVTRS